MSLSGLTCVLRMIINADILLPHLRRKAGSSHLEDAPVACPRCEKRTGLYVLKDGRQKCGACGKKFTAVHLRDERKLQQHANIMLCFCMEFTAVKTASLTKYRYRLVLDTYAHLRELLAEQNLTPPQRSLLRHRRGAQAKIPAFGARMRNGRIVLEPLPTKGPVHVTRGLSARRESPVVSYDAFIEDGELRRTHPQFRSLAAAHKKTGIGKIEYFWSWTQERLRRYHAISDRKMAYYLKECEWKYNHRLLSAQSQAILLVSLLPDGFLGTWSAY